MFYPLYLSLLNIIIPPNPNLEHKELGQIESIIKYGDNSIIAVHYPILGNEQIDNKIKSIIQGYVDGFIQLTKKNFSNR